MESPMIFRQLFDSVSGTYTYLIASRHGGEALIIDPVLEKVDRYLQLVRELELKLVKAVDTHLHADHVTGLGALRDRTHCITVMGEQPHADVVAMRVTEGDCIEIDGLSLAVLYTPGTPTIRIRSSWATACSPATCLRVPRSRADQIRNTVASEPHLARKDQLSRHLFADILQLIAELRPPPDPARA